MKKLLLLFCAVCLFNMGNSQVLGGYNLLDNLVSADHPDCELADNDYVIGMPNDSIWVNIGTGQVMQGMFGSMWSNGEGDELLIETGFNHAEISIRLILEDNSLSDAHVAIFGDWIDIEQINWHFIFSGQFCTEGIGQSSHYIQTFDFESDFGLESTDLVKGVEITFLLPDLDADLAGVYITDASIPLELTEKNQFEVSFYPNPIQNELVVRTDQLSGQYELQIVDLLGNLVHSQLVSDAQVIVDSSQWSEGLYLVRVGEHTHKIVKE
jgi:hypothetical protein